MLPVGTASVCWPAASLPLHLHQPSAVAGGDSAQHGICDAAHFQLGRHDFVGLHGTESGILSAGAMAIGQGCAWYTAPGTSAHLHDCCRVSELFKPRNMCRRTLQQLWSLPPQDTAARIQHAAASALHACSWRQAAQLTSWCPSWKDATRMSWVSSDTPKRLSDSPTFAHQHILSEPSCQARVLMLMLMLMLMVLHLCARPTGAYMLGAG